MSGRCIAISAFACKEYGCPYCGFRSSNSFVSMGCASSCICGECKRSFVVLADGIVRSPIGIGGNGETYHPQLQPHPREGTPSHGRPDTRPEGGGEFFSSRGIGLECLPCFCCGGKARLVNNIAAYVQCKDAGERIVEMFKASGSDVNLDYREYEPDYVQLKVGACDEHLPNLEKLDQLVKDGILLQPYIEEAKSIS